MFCYHSPEMQRGEGWCNGKSAHLPLLWPNSIPRPSVRCGLSLLLVLVLAPKVFLLIGLPVAALSINISDAYPPSLPIPLHSHPPPFPSPSFPSPLPSLPIPPRFPSPSLLIPYKHPFSTWSLWSHTFLPSG